MDQIITICSLAYHECPTCGAKWRQYRHKDPVNRSAGGNYCGTDYGHRSCIYQLALNHWDDRSEECAECLKKNKQT
jgi:hypothetical protein